MTAGVIPLWVFAIWNRITHEWIDSPFLIAIEKEKDKGEGSYPEARILEYTFLFVSLYSGFVVHKATGREHRDYDSRASIHCKNVQLPKKDIDYRKIPWKECSWVMVAPIARFDWDEFQQNKVLYTLKWTPVEEVLTYYTQHVPKE